MICILYLGSSIAYIREYFANVSIVTKRRETVYGTVCTHDIHRAVLSRSYYYFDCKNREVRKF